MAFFTGGSNAAATGTPVAVAIAAGSSHTCALLDGGGVKCWGWNRYGQLGDGTTTTRSDPTDVVGLSSGVRAISASGDSTCALLTTGEAKCWGLVAPGVPLGVASLTPVAVSGLPSAVTAIATGGGHICVLLTGGGVECWGGNGSGEVGDGTTTDRPTPVGVAGLSSGVLALSAGGNCALTPAGGWKCWGWNPFGVLGDGTTTDRPTPVDVTVLPPGVQAMSTGGVWACALLSTGGVKCWGQNGSFGRLGDGTTIDQLTPVDVVGLQAGVQAVAPGADGGCALMTTGGVKCWGQGETVGDGTQTDRLTPVDVVGLSSGVQAITAGQGHTCALTTSGAVKCWGYNGHHELGIGAPMHANSSSVPVDAMVDSTAPVLTLGVPDPVVEATGPSGAIVDWGHDLSAWDPDDQAGQPVCDPASGSTFAFGTTTVRCQSTDTHGNTGSVSFTVTVRDTTPPVIAHHDDVQVTPADADATSVVVGYTPPDVTDVVDPTHQASCSPAPGGSFSLGHTLVRCQARDVAGNRAADSFFDVFVSTTAAAPAPAPAPAPSAPTPPPSAPTPQPPSCAALAAAVDPLYKGLAWGSPPLWSFDFRPEFNLGIDVHANTADQARTVVLYALAGVPDATLARARCQGAPAVSPKPPPVDVTGYTDRAAALAATVNVSDLGSVATWSVFRIWLVALPSLSTNVKVYATSEAEARAIVASEIAILLALQATPPSSVPAAAPSSPAATAPKASAVEAVNAVGTVAIVDTSGSTKPSIRGNGLAVGSRVVTGPNSRVDIALAHASRVTVGPSTRVRVGGSTDKKLDLLKLAGIVYFRLAHPFKTRPVLHIRTPGVAVAVRDTSFTLETRRPGWTRVRVYAGTVDVVSRTGSQKHVVVKAGLESIVSGSAAPSRPRKFAAPTKPFWTH